MHVYLHEYISSCLLLKPVDIFVILCTGTVYVNYDQSSMKPGILSVP